MHPVPASRVQLQTSSEGRGPDSSAVGQYTAAVHQKHGLGQDASRTSRKTEVADARRPLLAGRFSLTHFRCLQWLLSQSINAFDDVKFEAASVVAELYQQQNQSNLAKPILRKAVELSQHNIYWHCRLIFQLAVSVRYCLFTHHIVRHVIGT